MGNKYLTFSFDDGLEQDKKIIKILRKHHLYGATFNLNSGLLGQRQYIGRIGNCGMKEVQEIPEMRKSVFTFHEQFRIPEDEIASVYKDYEIASHGRTHEYMIKMKEPEEFDAAIKEDIAKLAEISKEPIVGFAYPFGACNKKVKEYLRLQECFYARGVRSSKKYDFPKDFYEIFPTCHFKDKGLFRLFENFLNAESNEDLLFYVWGHGYEFDFGTKDSNWERFEKFCEYVEKNNKEIICLKNRELFSPNVLNGN